MILTASDTAYAKAKKRLTKGELVAFPTETVYGLGADACNDKAIAKIFEAKSRPKLNPLISHVSTIEMAANFAQMDKRAHALAQAFWPGALTLILPRKQNTPDKDNLGLMVSAGLKTVAIRMPDHPIALRLITDFGRPLAAPSANKSGELSPTSPAHIIKSLGDKAPLIIAGGTCRIGLESSVIDLTTKTPTLLRLGAINASQIAEILGEDIAENPKSTPKSQPKSPGQSYRHYAPNSPIRLNAKTTKPHESALAFGPNPFFGKNAKHKLNLSHEGDLTEAAANLFAMLHELDANSPAMIAVAPIPNIGLGRAINDRLNRAEEAQK